MLPGKGLSALAWDFKKLNSFSYILEPATNYLCDIQQVSTPLRPVLVILSCLNLIHLMDSGNYWIKFLNRILSNKSEQVNYLLAHRYVAMQQNILF